MVSGCVDMVCGCVACRCDADEWKKKKKKKKKNLSDGMGMVDAGTECADALRVVLRADVFAC